MRQIIGLVIALLVVSLHSFAGAAEVVRREGKDLVVYKQIESVVNRYKDVPPEVPDAEAIKIIRAGTGQYALPHTAKDYVIDFGFPIRLAFIERALYYQNGSWSVKLAEPSAPQSDWLLTCIFVVLPVVSLVLASVGNQKSEECGDGRIFLLYLCVIVTPLVGQGIRLGLIALHELAFDDGVLVLFFLLGLAVWMIVVAFRGVRSCAGLELAFLAGPLMMIVALLELVTGIKEQQFLQSGSIFWQNTIFLAGSCLGAYVLAKLVKRLFFKSKAGPPVSTESLTL